MHLHTVDTLQYLHISSCLVFFDQPQETFLMQTNCVCFFYLITTVFLLDPDLCGVQKHWLHSECFIDWFSNLCETFKIPKTAL